MIQVWKDHKSVLFRQLHVNIYVFPSPLPTNQHYSLHTYLGTNFSFILSESIWFDDRISNTDMITKRK